MILAVLACLQCHFAGWGGRGGGGLGGLGGGGGGGGGRASSLTISSSLHLLLCFRHCYLPECRKGEALPGENTNVSNAAGLYF